MTTVTRAIYFCNSGCTYLIETRVGAAGEETVELSKYMRQKCVSVGSTTHFYKQEEVRVLTLGSGP